MSCLIVTMKNTRWDFNLIFSLYLFIHSFILCISTRINHLITLKMLPAVRCYCYSTGLCYVLVLILTIKRKKSKCILCSFFLLLFHNTFSDSIFSITLSSVYILSHYGFQIKDTYVTFKKLR